MNYARMQATAYGMAMVSGENAFPQPDEPTYASSKHSTLAFQEKLRASQERCFAYKEARERRKQLPPGDLKTINQMYRSMQLGGGIDAVRLGRKED